MSVLALQREGMRCYNLTEVSTFCESWCINLKSQTFPYTSKKSSAWRLNKSVSAGSRVVLVLPAQPWRVTAGSHHSSALSTVIHNSNGPVLILIQWLTWDLHCLEAQNLDGWHASKCSECCLISLHGDCKNFCLRGKIFRSICLWWWRALHMPLPFSELWLIYRFPHCNCACKCIYNRVKLQRQWCRDHLSWLYPPQWTLLSRFAGSVYSPLTYVLIHMQQS